MTEDTLRRKIQEKNPHTKKIRSQNEKKPDEIPNNKNNYANTFKEKRTQHKCMKICQVSIINSPTMFASQTGPLGVAMERWVWSFQALREVDWLRVGRH